MQCNECKWFFQIGIKNAAGIWIRSKTESGWDIGWCKKNPPIRTDETTLHGWPETDEHQSCGSFEEKESAIEKQIRYHRLWRNSYNESEYRNSWLKKAIRELGEKHGISRRKQPKRILDLLDEKLQEAKAKKEG